MHISSILAAKFSALTLHMISVSISVYSRVPPLITKDKNVATGFALSDNIHLTADYTSADKT
jgi:hypothetical protein